MAATPKKRMTPDEWADVRAKWEGDPRDGYTWVVNEMNLSVSDVAVLKRARNEGWAKKASLKTIVERAQTKADEKVSRKVSGKVSPLTESDAVDLRADVIEKHREEWGEHRTTFPMSNMLGEDGLGVEVEKGGKVLVVDNADNDIFCVVASVPIGVEDATLRVVGTKRETKLR